MQYIFKNIFPSIRLTLISFPFLLFGRPIITELQVENYKRVKRFVNYYDCLYLTDELLGLCIRR